MRCQNATAQALAEFLADPPRVTAVHYPGLASHPQHALARRQMPGGFGGMLSFEVEGGVDAGRTILESFSVITHAVSLGGIETLAVHPASTTHAPPAKPLSSWADSTISGFASSSMSPIPMPSNVR